jgi:hypothetical protein
VIKTFGKHWNRSSAFSPEVLAVITTATSTAVSRAVEIFEGAVDVATLSDEQRAEAIKLLANGVTEGISKAVEKFKN